MLWGRDLTAAIAFCGGRLPRR